MPSEPARELMRKTRTCRASAARGGRQTLCTSTWHALELAARRRTWQPGELNASIIACRAWALVLPSSRKYGTTLRRGSKGARVCALNAAGGATSDSSSRLERHAAPLPTSRLTCHAGRAPPPPRHRWAATGGKQQACEWAQRGSTSRGRGRSAAPLPAPVAAPAGIAGRSLGLCRGGSARQHPAAVLKVVKKVLHDVQHLRVWVCVWGGGARTCSPWAQLRSPGTRWRSPHRHPSSPHARQCSARRAGRGARPPAGAAAAAAARAACRWLQP